MTKYEVQWHERFGVDMLVLGIDGVRRVYSPRPPRMGVIPRLPPALAISGGGIARWLVERGIQLHRPEEDWRYCTAIIEDDDIAFEFRMRFA